MGKYLCLLFLLSFAPACEMDGNNGLPNSTGVQAFGDLQLNNKTTWSVIDVFTGAPDNNKWCMTKMEPGSTMTLTKIYAPAEPRSLRVLFQDTDGKVVPEYYQITLVPNGVTNVGLEGLPDHEGSSPPSGTVSVSYP